MTNITDLTSHESEVIDFNALLIDHSGEEPRTVTSVDIRAVSLAKAVADLQPLIGLNQTMELTDLRDCSRAAIIYPNTSVAVQTNTSTKPDVWDLGREAVWAAAEKNEILWRHQSEIIQELGLALKQIAARPQTRKTKKKVPGAV